MAEDAEAAPARRSRRAPSQRVTAERGRAGTAGSRARPAGAERSRLRPGGSGRSRTAPGGAEQSREDPSAGRPGPCWGAAESPRRPLVQGARPDPEAVNGDLGCSSAPSALSAKLKHGPVAQMFLKLCSVLRGVPRSIHGVGVNSSLAEFMRFAGTNQLDMFKKQLFKYHLEGRIFQ